MSAYTLHCDHAIFTSIRTPTGEGYRIIAASKGLRDDEKQKITRCSPSHDALCHTSAKDNDHEDHPRAVEFYPLPSGRLALSLSVNAGAEQTGRGGQRIFTYIVVFAEEYLERCGYSPHSIIRAMITAGLHQPQLKPPATLPELQLILVDPSPPNQGVDVVTLPESLNEAWFTHVLGEILSGQEILINLDKGWSDSAEALLTAVPGPMRSKISFTTGLRYSLARHFRMAVLLDDHQTAKKKISGQKVMYMDTKGEAPASGTPDTWLTFVMRYITTGRLDELSWRTSLPFEDVSPKGRAWIGALYNDYDDLDQMESDAVLDKSVGFFEASQDTISGAMEMKLLESLVGKAQQILVDRFTQWPWEKMKQHWLRLYQIGGLSEMTRQWVQPILEAAMECALRDDPLDAARTALSLVEADSPLNPDRQEILIDKVLSFFATWADQVLPENMETILQITREWEIHRPESNLLSALEKKCASPSSASS